MKRKFHIIYPLIICLIISLAAHAQQVHWPKGKKAAIVLTYDDALRSQLNNAVPQLLKAGIKATFFVTSDIDSLSIPKWRKLAKKGYELGNHTLYHPCSATEDDPVRSETYTAYKIIREIEITDRFLFAVDGKTKRTFAYPCTETFVAGGRDYVDSLRKFKLVKYARVGGDSSTVITDFKNLDTLRVPSYGLDGGENGETLVTYVKNVEQKGGLGVIMLHGVGGDYISISPEAHGQLIAYLKKHKKDIWIPTFQQALDEVYRQVKRPKVNIALTSLKH